METGNREQANEITVRTIFTTGTHPKGKVDISVFLSFLMRLILITYPCFWGTLPRNENSVRNIFVAETLS